MQPVGRGEVVFGPGCKGAGRDDKGKQNQFAAGGR